MSALTFFWNNIDDTDEEDTKPLRLAFFNVQIVERPLFYTVTHQMVADVDGITFLTSPEQHVKPSQNELNEWARGIILWHRNALKVLNVAVEETYERFGGNRFDLLQII